MEYVKDIVYKHVGMHVNKPVLITVHGNVLLIVVVDVLKDVQADVQDVVLVLDHVKDKQQVVVVLDVA